MQTFTIGFEEAAYSELDDARVVAHYLGTDHHEMIVKPAAFDILPRLVWHLDEPFGDSSAVPTYYVCQAARQHVTVALSGDGGDEVFAGYTRYQELQRYRRMARLPSWMRRHHQPLDSGDAVHLARLELSVCYGRVSSRRPTFRVLGHLSVYPGETLQP